LLLKGFTQLKLVDANILGQLLPRGLPKLWNLSPETSEDGSGMVEWLPGESGQPPVGWLESLWNYLVTNSPQDLSAFEGLPIIPARIGRKVCVAVLVLQE
jgi:sacsin